MNLDKTFNIELPLFAEVPEGFKVVQTQVFNTDKSVLFQYKFNKEHWLWPNDPNPDLNRIDPNGIFFDGEVFVFDKLKCEYVHVEKNHTTKIRLLEIDLHQILEEEWPEEWLEKSVTRPSSAPPTITLKTVLELINGVEDLVLVGTDIRSVQDLHSKQLLSESTILMLKKEKDFIYKNGYYLTTNVFDQLI